MMLTIPNTKVDKILKDSYLYEHGTPMKDASYMLDHLCFGGEYVTEIDAQSFCGYQTYIVIRRFKTSDVAAFLIGFENARTFTGRTAEGSGWEFDEYSIKCYAEKEIVTRKYTPLNDTEIDI